MKTMKIVVTLLFFAILQYLCVKSFGQLPIDIDEAATWPIINTENSRISADGRYVGYERRLLSTPQIEFILKQTTGSWKRNLSHSSEDMIGFTNDSRFFLYKFEGDSIAVLRLGTEIETYISDVKKLVIPNGNYKDKILYQTTAGNLVLQKMLSGQQYTLGKVTNFELAGDNNTVLLTSVDSSGMQKLAWLDLLTLSIHFITSGSLYSSPKWSDDFKSLAFLERVRDSTKVMWFEKSKGLKTLKDNHEYFRAKQLKIAEILAINYNNASLELQWEQATSPEIKISKLKPLVNIWSFSDEKLHPNKPYEPSPNPRIFKSLMFISTGEILQLTKDGTNVHEKINGWYVCSDGYGYFIVSAIDGKLKRLKNVQDVEKIRNLVFVSADGNNAVYYFKNQYYRYDISGQQSYLIDVGSKSPVWHQRDYLQTVSQFYGPVDRVTVLSSNIFRVRDQYDIWIMDASGKQSPRCITKGYGSKNNLVFDVLKDKEVAGKDVYLNGRLLLKAFNVVNKKSGFFICDPSKENEPVCLTLGNFKYNLPLRSGDGKNWLVSRESSNISPNYFLTDTFGEFLPVTSNYPEKGKFGLDILLLRGKLPNGEPIQSALFRPLGFDSTKKYPVIVNYYEKKTDEINSFLRPQWIKADIDIPWFISQGYLVMQTDILFRLGNTGMSALESVNAATNELVKLRYVDSSRLGLNGHSFGGYETLFFLTHNTRFTAAVAGAPISNLVSFTQSEHFQLRMFSTLWENTSGYIENSPIFNADKVKSPLLMMHNRADANVEFSNGMEFFLAMRRLGKPCWLLEYEGDRHSLKKTENRRDYTIRMTQFYNHYLKGAPAPLWMTKGMMYRDRKYTPGYELDLLDSIPGLGINSVEEQRKIDEYSKVPFAEKLRPLIEQKKN